MPPRERARFPWWTGAAAFALVGTALRLWGWSSQILLDDEWHALNFVSGRTLGDVLLQQGLGANSIPVNVITWLLLHTVGWSEPWLRLPSMIAGIAALAVVPALVARLWGPRAATIAAALLSVSPLAIFYSRVTRPYAPAMLFATSSVLLTLGWLKEGKRRDILLSAACGSLAVHYHLYATIPVCVPLLVAAGAALKPVAARLGLSVASERPRGDLFRAGAIVAVAAGVLVVLPNALNPWWAHGIQGRDRATWETARTVLGLLAGTDHLPSKLLVLVLVPSGLVLVARESRTLGLALALPFLVFALVMATTTQDGAHAGIQVARYGIAFFPLSFAAIGVAVARTGDLLERKLAALRKGPALAIAALALWAPFLVTSPLRRTCRFPNNFTNHSAFEYRYDPIDWDLSPERDLAPGVRMRRSEVPPFYFETVLLRDCKGIVEYPVMVGDHFNLYYYYQHFHRRPVAAGYLSRGQVARNPPGEEWVYGDSSIDYVMTGLPEPLKRRSSWRAMVDLDDLDRLRAEFGGWLIVVHLSPMREVLHRYPDYLFSRAEAARLVAAFGPPLYQDGVLAAWKVR